MAEAWHPYQAINTICCKQGAASALCPNLEPATVTSALFNLFGRITTEIYTLE